MKSMTTDELMKLSREDMTSMILQMQTTINTLTEQIVIANANKFGSKSEKLHFLDGQMTLYDVAFNEAEGLSYSLNQEKQLRAFLDNSMVPIDNSATERAIRPFTIGRSNWHVIDTVHGADASAIIYSLVETAKANQLKIYEYLKYLLETIPCHLDDTNLDFVDDLLPWSASLPTYCHKS